MGGDRGEHPSCLAKEFQGRCLGVIGDCFASTLLVKAHVEERARGPYLCLLTQAGAAGE